MQVYTCMNIGFMMYHYDIIALWHFSHDAKINPLSKDFCGILNKFWQKAPFFLKNCILTPKQCILCFINSTAKNSFHTIFCWCMCTPIYLITPPPPAKVLLFLWQRDAKALKLMSPMHCLIENLQVSEINANYSYNHLCSSSTTF